MPIKGGRLTGREQVFIERLSATGDKNYAAEKAGFPAPQRDAWRLLQRPGVQAEVVKAQQARLFNDLLPLAIDTLQTVMQSKTATERGKLAAAVHVVKATLGGAGTGAEGEKDPSEMTLDEIIQRSEALQRERAGRAKDVTPIEPESSVFD